MNKELLETIMRAHGDKNKDLAGGHWYVRSELLHHLEWSWRVCSEVYPSHCPEIFSYPGAGL